MEPRTHLTMDPLRLLLGALICYPAYCIHTYLGRYLPSTDLGRCGLYKIVDIRQRPYLCDRYSGGAVFKTSIDVVELNSQTLAGIIAMQARTNECCYGSSELSPWLLTLAPYVFFIFAQRCAQSSGELGSDKSRVTLKSIFGNPPKR